MLCCHAAYVRSMWLMFEVQLKHTQNETPCFPVLGSSKPVLGAKLKQVHYVFWLFFKVSPCLATSIKTSRRDLNDVAEHMPISKNNQNTHYPRLVSHPTQVQHSLKRVVFTVTLT